MGEDSRSEATVSEYSLLLFIVRTSRAPTIDNCERGDRRGMLRWDPLELTGEGGTNGNVDKSESVMLDAVLCTDMRDDLALALSIACRCCCSSTPDDGPGTLGESAALKGAVRGVWGRSWDGGTSIV